MGNGNRKFSASYLDAKPDIIITLNLIGEALLAHGRNRPNENEHLCLSRGLPGVCLCLFEIATLCNNSKYANCAIDLCDYICDISNFENFDLYSGILGIGWVQEYLLKKLNPEELRENNRIDELALEHLNQTRDSSIMMSIGIYSLERVPNSLAYACLEEIVKILKTDMHRNGKMLEPEILSAHVFPFRNSANTLFPSGSQNGFPWLLARCYQQGLRENDIEALIYHGLLSHIKNYKTILYREPSKYEGKSFATVFSIISSIISCLVCAELIDNNDIKNDLIECLQYFSSLEWSYYFSTDCRLSGGPSGMLLLMDKAYSLTGDNYYHALARFWLNQILVSGKGFGPGGFQFYDPIRLSGRDIWANSYGLDSGLSGVGLALSVILKPGATNWLDLLGF